MPARGLWERLEPHGAEAALGPSGLAASSLLEALEAGRSPAQVAADFALEAADLVAVLGRAALGAEGTEGPGLVQAPPPRPRLAASLNEASWASLIPGSSRPARLALMAGLLQVHDFWDASHTAAQQADDLGEHAFSAYWHAIAHRREPDSGNASYWFRRVGRHPLYAPLGAAAAALLREQGEEGLVERLAPGGSWNPSAFLGLCADGRPAANLGPLARKLQRLEMALLLEATAAGLGLV